MTQTTTHRQQVLTLALRGISTQYDYACSIEYKAKTYVLTTPKGDTEFKTMKLLEEAVLKLNEFFLTREYTKEQTYVKPVATIVQQEIKTFFNLKLHAKVINAHANEVVKHCTDSKYWVATKDGFVNALSGITLSKQGKKFKLQKAV